MQRILDGPLHIYETFFLVNLLRGGCKMFIFIVRSNLVNVHKFLRIFSALLCTFPQFAPRCSLYLFCLDVAGIVTCVHGLVKYGN